MGESQLTAKVIESVLIVALTALGLILVQVACRRALKIVEESERVRVVRRQQLITLVGVLRWTGNTLLLVSAVLMLLATFGIDITPLLAAVGVAGLAVSLGAQTLIKDTIGGILILLENQYSVGDTIEVGHVSGEVTRITLRATQMRDQNGHLHIVPNGEVRIVSNQTREWSRALVDIGVAYEEDLDRALKVLRQSAEAFAQDPVLGSQLLEPPQVLGPTRLGDWAVSVRVTVKTQPGKQWEIARELRSWILATCEREGITLPYPRQEVLVSGLNDRSAS